MRVEFEYSGAIVVGHPPESVELPPHFSIWLKWDQAADDDEAMYVSVGQSVEVVLTTGDPVLLLGIDGIVRDLAAWRLVPEIIGPTIWQDALRVLDQELVDVTVDVNVGDLEPYRGSWCELQAAAHSGRVRGMYANRDEAERLFAILRADPALWEAHLTGMRNAVRHLQSP